MEALLVRIDHFHDRVLYVSTLKTWLNELGISHGRLVTMGDFHLLFIEASSDQNTKLLSFFPSKNIDTNAKNEPCSDRFVDVVGRKPIEKPACKGFLEMNILNATMLEKLLVDEWGVEKQWITDALSTPRTKALIKWKEEAKNQRRDRRKRAAQDRDTERAAKRARAEQEAAEKAKQEAEKGDEDDEEDAEEDTPSEAPVVPPADVVISPVPPTKKNSGPSKAAASHRPPPQQQRSSKHKNKKHKPYTG